MFIMMNAARFGVGMQGIAVADRAYQKAVAYAKDRVQTRPVDGSSKDAAAIIHHPDVRRMLMTQRALVEGCRAMAIDAAAAYDMAHHHEDAETRKEAQAFYEFMVPLVKGYSTEMSLEVTSLGVQVHGGMGFIEETGAAQYYRDARILPIYEGTTAIQANDLVGRKTVRDGGAFARGVAAQVEETEGALAANGSADALAVRAQLAAARGGLRRGGGLHRRQRQGQAQRGVRGVRALSDGGRQPDGRLAAGALAAGGAGAQGGRSGCRVHGRQDRHRAVLRRAHPAALRGAARRGRQRRGQRDGAARRRVLTRPDER